MTGGQRAWRLFAVIVLVTLAVHIGPLTPASASRGVRLRPVPRSLNVLPDVGTLGEIIATNHEAKPIRDLRLQVKSGGSGLRPRVAPRRPIALLPGASVAWTVTLSPASSLTSEDRVWAFAHFNQATGGRGIAATSIGLRPTPGARVGKVASLKVHPSSLALESGKTTSVYLTIRNKSAEPLVVVDVKVKRPDFISTHRRDDKITVPPGRVGVVELQVGASDRVSPGDRELVFRVPVRIGNGKPLDLIGSEQLQVGVVGETALLTVLGVPSLLLIPGFLFLATFMLLWRIRALRPAWDDSGFEMGPTDPGFWVVAIGASIAILPVARLLGTDLFETYGIEDLARLWTGSFLLGVVAYLGVIGVRHLQHRRRVLSAKDGPVDVLRKLSRAHLNLNRPRARCKVGTDEINLYVLEEEGGKDEAWMAPAIICSIPEGAGDNEVVRRLRAGIDEGAGGRTVARLISQGVRQGQLEARWSPEGRSVEGPRRISDTDVHERLPAASLVEVET